ncbi:MAG: UbiA prenyltransferase [Chloroflexi bacterium]|nr:UbiA prenyltransferase [Chloroflexota bacterium]
MALLAGGAVPDAIRLGLAMTAIQVSIGGLNDLVDAPLDRGRRPVKPVAEGLIRPGTVRIVVVAGATIGLGLSAASGLPALLVAASGAACGYLYDLRLSRTPWGWLPLAIAIPLVPLYAWVGVAGSPPPALLPIVPMGMLGGAGLAIGNALVDLGTDARAGAKSIAVRLGHARAWGFHALALVSALGLALATLPVPSPPPVMALVMIGAAALGTGIFALLLGWRAGRRAMVRLGWQVEALGIAALGVGWLAGLALGSTAA